MYLGWFTIAFAWVSIIIFLGLVAYKFYRIKTMPLNLRWEVYPVPHETGAKREYGGSYMEEVNWSQRPRESSKLAELLEMGAEVFTLKRVRLHNPYQIWPLSLALHWGLYLLVIWIGFLAITNWLPFLTTLTTVIGTLSLVFGFAGSLGLIIKRITNPDLRLYTTPIDYFNLVFLAVIFSLGLISWAPDSSFLQHQVYLRNMLTLKPGASPPAVTALFFSLQTFAIYMPFSKLIHYVMKHFTFTETLCDDAFNLRYTQQNAQLETQLEYPKSWSAPHFSSEKTWIEDVQSTAQGELER
jgi:nitrate reductase gamma subunit